MTRKYSPTTLPYAPVQALPRTDASAWTPCDKQRLTFRLGNKASVEEISGHRETAHQKWRFRICALGGETAVHDRLEAAMRAAEFALGIGEMPVRLAENPASKNGGAA